MLKRTDTPLCKQRQYHDPLSALQTDALTKSDQAAQNFGQAGLCLATSQGFLPLANGWQWHLGDRPGRCQPWAKAWPNLCTAWEAAFPSTLRLMSKQTRPPRTTLWNTTSMANSHSFVGNSSCRQKRHLHTHSSFTFPITKTPLVRSCLQGRRRPGPPQRVC